jgi:hypothetical protein
MTLSISRPYRITDELDTIWKEAFLNYLLRQTEENPRKTLDMTTGVPP